MKQLFIILFITLELSINLYAQDYNHSTSDPIVVIDSKIGNNCIMMRIMNNSSDTIYIPHNLVNKDNNNQIYIILKSPQIYEEQLLLFLTNRVSVSQPPYYYDLEDLNHPSYIFKPNDAVLLKICFNKKKFARNIKEVLIIFNNDIDLYHKL